jgi:hypothetical protein
MISLKYILAAATAAVVFVAPASATPTQYLTNGNFETGTLTGWTTSLGTPAGYTQTLCCDSRSTTGSIVSANGALSRIGGSYSLYGDFDGGLVKTSTGAAQYNTPTDIYLSQTFLKAGELANALLSFSFQVGYGQSSASYINNPNYGGHVDPRMLYVTLSSAGQSNTVYTYQVPDSSLGIHPLQNVNVDVTAFLNSLPDGNVTLTIDRRSPQYFTGGGYFVADNFSLTAQQAVPEPASLALLGLGFAGMAALRRKRKA